jgi:CheY-like chemotaxis protein
VVRLRPGSSSQTPGVAVWVPPDRVDDRHRLEQLSAAAAAAAEAKQPAYRVLLVEDNSLVAAMYASALRRLAATEGLGGLAVDVAVDGNEAFARLLAQPPLDLVITDVYMPVMSGFALVEKIRAEPRLRHLPVIVISSAGEEERQKVSRLGANFFLQKPVKYQDIVTTVRTLLLTGPQPGAPMSARQVPRPDQRPQMGIPAPTAVDPLLRRGQKKD